MPKLRLKSSSQQKPHPRSSEPGIFTSSGIFFSSTSKANLSTQNTPEAFKSPEFPTKWEFSAHQPLASTQEVASIPKRVGSPAGSWLRLEKTSQITESNHQPWAPANHVPKCHLHMFLEHFQGWELHHFHRQLLQCWTIQELPAKVVSPPKIPAPGLGVST